MRQVALNVLRESPDIDPLTYRLEALARLADADREAAHRLLSAHVRQFSARRDMIREGEPPRAYAIIEGWACRYKTLPDGQRQILDFLIPGDLFDFHALELQSTDHSLGAITEVKAGQIGPAELGELMAIPGFASALRRSELIAVSIQREWMLNVGQRAAYERVAHLLCEMFLRLRAAGLAQAGRCDFPLTQTDIADACGLTAVHVNRMLQGLRAGGLISLRDRRLTIPDLPRLMKAGQFRANYLHLDDFDRRCEDDA
jgi:CRP-like cAMP-binding protein